MNSTPKMSIIVPIYNAGIYLKDCLNSIVNQTLKDIEIILVIDCPTDGSDKIAKEYANHDSRIILIENKSNLNIGLCRNEGLNVAKGEYIGFVDHDDYCDLKMYECMYNKAIEGKYDIIVTPPNIVYKERIETLYYPSKYSIDLRYKLLSLTIGYDKNEDIGEWKNFATHGDMWDKIFKRSLIKNHNIKFVDNRYITFEDLLFLKDCFFYSEKVEMINKPFYYHVYHENNTISQYSYFSPELIVGFLSQMHNFLLNNQLLDTFKKRFDQTIINNAVLSYLNEKNNKKQTTPKVFIKKISLNYIIEAFRNQPISLSKKTFNSYGIVQLSIALYFKILYYKYK